MHPEETLTSPLVLLFRQAVGADKQIAYSTLDEIVGYIPTISSDLFSFPLIACISEEVDPELFEWYVVKT